MATFNLRRLLGPDDDAKANVLLLQYVTAPPDESPRVLAGYRDRLVEAYMLPQINRTLARRIDPDERDDTLLDVYVVVQAEESRRVARMRGVWLEAYSQSRYNVPVATRNARQNPFWIRDYLKTVSVEAQRAWATRLAKDNPGWSKMRDDLKTMLKTEGALGLWLCPGCRRSAAGLAEWDGQPARATALLMLIKDDPLTYYRAALQDAVPNRMQTGSLVSRLFERVAHTILLRYLVSIVQKIQEIAEPTYRSMTDLPADNGSPLDREFGDAAPGAEDQEILKIVLRENWALLDRLSLLQRRAIVLQALSAAAPMGDRLLDSVQIRKIASVLETKLEIEPNQTRSAFRLAIELQIPWLEFAEILTRLPFDAGDSDTYLRALAGSRWTTGNLVDLGLDSLDVVESLLAFAPRTFSELLLRLPLDDAEIAALCGSSKASVAEARSVGKTKLAALSRELAREKPDLLSPRPRGSRPQMQAARLPSALAGR